MASGRATVRITAGAERDLHGIYRRRLAQRGVGGADGAHALLGQLVAAIESLADFSGRGPVPPELDALGIRDFRQLSLPPFRVVYLLEEEGKSLGATVTIVADGRRDFRTLLQERLLGG
jgi:plasmid stabilization system protein ParE